MIGVVGLHRTGCERLGALLAAMGAGEVRIAGTEVPSGAACVLLRADPAQEMRALDAPGWSAWELAERELVRKLAGARFVAVSLDELALAPTALAGRLARELAALGVAGLREPASDELAGLPPLCAEPARESDLVRAERAELRLAELETAARAERRELMRLAERAEADTSAILRSRRYRFANVVAGAAQRLLPRLAWDALARGLRLAHPFMVRRAARAIRPEPPSSLAALSARLAGADDELPAEPVELGRHLSEAVAVIVPVHDAPGALAACLAALERHLTAPVELVLVDDASADPRTAQVLARYAGRAHVTLLHNARNLGYTRSVNRALEVTRGDVVLLNSDAEVGPRFLEQLAVAAYGAERVASVTAVSDNAGAFSVPVAEEANELPASLDAEAAARLLAQRGSPLAPEVPTASGFCVYLRRAALDEVGLFDAEAFPRGYGEENDWCRRAAALGWTHRVCGRTFVRHRRSASFGSERAALARAGRAVIDERYPEYGEELRRFQRSPQMAQVRAAAAAAFARPVAAPRPRVLFLVFDGSGGVPRSSRDLMHGLAGSYDPFLLTSDGQDLQLSRLADGELQLVHRARLGEPLTAARSTDPAYRAFLSQCLARHAIELVHVRHLLGHGLDAPGVAADLRLPLVVSFHDFYFVCPTVHLLDERDRFCAGTCTPGDGRCRVPTRWAGELPHLKHRFVHEWQAQVRSRVLAHGAAFVTTSRSARELLEGVYPELARARFALIEHGRDLVQRELATEPVPGEPLRVLVLGELTPAKGGYLIREIAARDVARRVEWHFLGHVNPEFAGVGRAHGQYRREELAERLGAVRPHVVGLFSIFAETWSHTLTEAWSCGVPVVATNLGAFAERIGARGGGWLVDPRDPAACLRALIEIADDPGTWRERAARANLEGNRDVAAMSRDYAVLYEEVLASRRLLRGEPAAAPAVDGA